MIHLLSIRSKECRAEVVPLRLYLGQVLWVGGYINRKEKSAVFLPGTRANNGLAVDLSKTLAKRGHHIDIQKYPYNSSVEF